MPVICAIFKMCATVFRSIPFHFTKKMFRQLLSTILIVKPCVLFEHWMNSLLFDDDLTLRTLCTTLWPTDVDLIAIASVIGNWLQSFFDWQTHNEHFDRHEKNRQARQTLLLSVERCRQNGVLQTNVFYVRTPSTIMTISCLLWLCCFGHLQYNMLLHIHSCTFNYVELWTLVDCGWLAIQLACITCCFAWPWHMQSFTKQINFLWYISFEISPKNKKKKIMIMVEKVRKWCLCFLG